MIVKSQSASGFTLLELVISLALLLVISGAVLGSMMASQKNFRGQQIRISLDQQMRGALELMSAEIGQAGLPLSRLAGSNTASNDNALLVTQAAGSLAADTGAGFSGTVQVKSNSAAFPFYPNQTIIVDTAGAKEEAILTATDANSKTVTGTFVNPHHRDDPIFSAGLYPEGVLWFDDGTYSVPPGPTPPPNVYTGYELWIFGDITNQGALDLISYKCKATATSYQLIRATYDMAPTQTLGCTKPSELGNTQEVVLLDNVLNCNTASGLAPPFTLVAMKKGTALNPSNYNFITSVSISLQMQSTSNDPQTNQPVKLTKSFLNVQPRNIVAAYNVVTTDVGEFQENPQFGAFSCFPKY